MGNGPKPLFFVSLVYASFRGNCPLDSRRMALCKCARALWWSFAQRTSGVAELSICQDMICHACVADMTQGKTRVTLKRLRLLIDPHKELK